MKNSKFLSLITAILLTASACAPVYIPTMHNVPVLKEKGEIQGQVWAGTSGFDLQASYMNSDRTAIMGAASLSSGGSDNKHVYLEGGYGILNTSKSNLTLSAFGGLAAGAAQGKGIFTINGTPYTTTGSSFILKPFVQGNVGFQSKYFNIGLSSRFAWVQFLTLTVNGEKQDPPSYFFVEPLAYMSLGKERLKVNANFGISFPANTNSISIDYFPIMFGFGIQYALKSRK
jgi:hypothetical protein